MTTRPAVRQELAACHDVAVSYGSGDTTVEALAGVSCRETFKRLKLVGREPRSLSAILITHEHSDHVSGLAMLAKKLGIPVFMTGGTHQAWARSLRDDAGQLPTLAKLEIFSAGRQFQIADITVMPFTIPHDAADPVGFVFRTEGLKIGMATDLGYMPASVKVHLRGCDALVIESNHDVEMLRGSVRLHSDRVPHVVAVRVGGVVVDCDLARSARPIASGEDRRVELVVAGIN